MIFQFLIVLLNVFYGSKSTRFHWLFTTTPFHWSFTTIEIKWITVTIGSKDNRTVTIDANAKGNGRVRILIGC